MKRRILLLAAALLLGASCALAQSGGSETPKKEFDIWDVDFDNLDPEDADRIERYKEEARQDRLKKLREEATPKAKDYDNNTVCSFGPQFRDVSPRMTDEWYMFTPIDLSTDGEQTFELIAGNMYVIGEVTVTVKDGVFEVNYAYSDRHIQAGREYFHIFADYESVTGDDLDSLPKGFTYGKKYDIEKKLGGDTDVLLFVCNTASFKKTTPGVVSYYRTNPDREAAREAMLDMIGK